MESISLNLIGEIMIYSPAALASLVCCNRRTKERLEANISVFHRMLEELWPDHKNYRTLDLSQAIQEIYYQTTGISLIPIYDKGEQMWRLFRVQTKDSVEWAVSPANYRQPPHFVFLSPTNVFFLGGQDDDQVQLRCTFKANTRSQTFEETKQLIHPRMYCGTVKFKTLVYVFGGYPASSWDQAEVYDPQLNDWSLLPQLPVICKNADSGVFRDKIYTAVCESGPNNGRVIVFNPSNDSYQEIQRLLQSEVCHRTVYATNESLVIHESGGGVYILQGDVVRKENGVPRFQVPHGQAARFADWIYVACSEHTIYAANEVTGQKLIISPEKV